MKRYLLILGLAVGLLMSFSGQAAAQQPTPSDDEVNAIASQLYCPVCENTPLDVCPTQACQDWRDLIRQMLTEGKSTVDIKKYFVDHYGARVLSEPPRAGFNWLIYIVPPLAFLAGVFLLFQAVRLWRKVPIDTSTVVTPNPDSETNSGSDDAYIFQLEEELRKREEGNL